MWDKLAILIPTRNRPELLSRTLSELKRVGLAGVSLFVYDDASEDPEAVRKTVADCPGVRLLRGERRVGQSEGRNVLMRACDKEFALLLEDDSFPEDIAGLAPHLEGQPWPASRAVVTFQCRSLADGRLSTPASVPAGPMVSFLGGASLLHVPSLLSVGGFRPFFVYGYEEPELALRLWIQGLQVWYDPRVVILHNHFECAGERRDHREYDYLYARNSILMYSLNMPLPVGLGLGLAVSLRRSFYRRRNYWAKLRGTLAGLWLSLSQWSCRRPCRYSQLSAWFRFSRGGRS